MYTALAIIINNDNVLIGKLKPGKIRDYGGIEYVFPSAQSENKEEIEKTLMQEVKMQSDLEVSVVDKIGERVHPITQNRTEYYLCKIIHRQEVKLSKDADVEKFIWVKSQDILDYMPSLFEKVLALLRAET